MSYQTQNSGQPPPYAGQYNQAYMGQPPVHEHHLPAAPVVVEPVSNTVPVVFGRTPVPTICCHCRNTVSFNLGGF